MSAKSPYFAVKRDRSPEAVVQCKYTPASADTATAASAVEGFFAAASAHSPAHAVRESVSHKISANDGDEIDSFARDPPEATPRMRMSDWTPSGMVLVMTVAAEPRMSTLFSEVLRRDASDFAEAGLPLT